MSNVTRRALRVYSALTELRGTDQDVLDALIPFFEPILTVMNGKIFDPHTFSAGVRKLYRWRFTGDIAQRFVPRLERKGYLRRVAGTSEGTIWVVDYQPTAGALNHIPIEGIIEDIIDEFQNFPPRVTDILSYKKTREELKDILVRFLVSMDSHGEGAYAPQLGLLEPTGDAREVIEGLEEGGRPLDSNDRYMCARFVRYLIDERPDYSVHLTRLASIALLTEVVEDFLKPTGAETRSDLVIALDAPLALDFLGCSGPALKDDIKILVDALKNVGVGFIVFPESCAEMQRNLSTMLGRSADQRHGYTHSAMLKGQVDRDYVAAVANNPERALHQAGITVRQMSLDTLPSSHRYFNEEQYQDFFASILWGNEVPAREHDATCLALIMRLRESRHSSDLFKSKYVLVTRNGTFVRHSRNYCLKGRLINEVQEGPVIHQRELATMAWLRTGLGGDDSIPRGHLIASCDRVLLVRPELRQALALQLSRATPERLEQLSLLMQDSRSVQKLADLTLNNEAVISEANAQHLLDVMREATAEDLRQRHQVELDAERAARSEEKALAEARQKDLEEAVTRANERDLAAAQLAEGQVTAVIRRVNQGTRRIEVGVTSVLIVLGFLAGVEYFTGWVGAYRFWSVVLMVAGAFGLYRLIWAVRERPTRGLATVLNVIAKWQLSRRLNELHLSGLFPADKFEIKGGYVSPPTTTVSLPPPNVQS